MNRIIEKPVLDPRDDNAHKGTFGTALLICGSYGMAGAAVLAARAALKSGVGIARIMMPDSIYPIVTKSVSEAVFFPCGGKRSKKFGITACSMAKKALRGVTGILIGCGIGQGFFCRKLLRYVVKNAECPLIIDADGINMLSRNIDILKQAKAPVILTPHPGEMSRLCSTEVAKIEKNREEIAISFAKKHNAYIVLKGHETVVATPDGQVFINKTGNSGMATGGSGDTLAGIMVARLAITRDAIKAVCESVYIHGAAGDMAAERLSKTSMLPGDMISELPCVFKFLEG